MIRGIHHTAVSVTSLERSLAFYQGLLGFQPVMDFSWPEGTENMNRTHQLNQTAGRVVLLKCGNAMLELFEYTTPAPRPRDDTRRMVDHGLIHFCLDVQDLDGEYERLTKAGVEFHCSPVDYGTVKLTYGRDPDGNVIEFQEIKSAQDPIALPAIEAASSESAPGGRGERA
jgi:catechol 2,3-dioxygenase-like lactoylglutathione lyase family enzyme